MDAVQDSGNHGPVRQRGFGNLVRQPAVDLARVDGQPIQIFRFVEDDLQRDGEDVVTLLQLGWHVAAGIDQDGDFLSVQANPLLLFDVV